MQLALFWIFAAFTLAFGLGVVFFRSPVSSAMSLVMSFIGLAALFVTLDAFFIGVVQVLVYAGAVMVLFLFIIMLLDLRADQRRPVKLSAWAGGGFSSAVFWRFCRRSCLRSRRSSRRSLHLPTRPSTMSHRSVSPFSAISTFRSRSSGCSSLCPLSEWSFSAGGN